MYNFDENRDKKVVASGYAQHATLRAHSMLHWGCTFSATSYTRYIFWWYSLRGFKWILIFREIETIRVFCFSYFNSYFVPNLNVNSVCSLPVELSKIRACCLHHSFHVWDLLHLSFHLVECERKCRHASSDWLVSIVWKVKTLSTRITTIATILFKSCSLSYRRILYDSTTHRYR